jgi:hypothetical protein
MAKIKYHNGTDWVVAGTDASAVDIVDSGELYTATNVEDALAEVKNQVATHEANNTTAHGVGNKLNKAGGTIENYTEKMGIVSGTSGNVTFDLSTGNTFTVTPTGSINLSFINPPANGVVCSFTLILRQLVTPYSVTFPADWYWVNSTVPVVNESDNYYIITGVSTSATAGGWLTSLFGKFL